MATATEYRDMLLRAAEAHREFKETVKASRTFGKRHRIEAEKAAKRLKGTRETFFKSVGAYSLHLKTVSEQLRAGSVSAVDQALDFLATDVKAPNSGYLKEKLCRQLKKANFSKSQVQRLYQIALARCVSNEYRREDSELRRLMIRRADLEFLKRVAEIPARKESRAEGHRNKMLQVILTNRSELRLQVKALIAKPEPTSSEEVEA